MALRGRSICDRSSGNSGLHFVIVFIFVSFCSFSCDRSWRSKCSFQGILEANVGHRASFARALLKIDMELFMGRLEVDEECFVFFFEIWYKKYYHNSCINNYSCL